MDGELLDITRDDTVVVEAEDVATTWTSMVAVRPSAVAVTVMVRGVDTPAVERVAIAEPVESVTGWVTSKPPDVDSKLTGTPAMRLFDELSASTVIVAVTEPSDGMDVALLVAVSAARCPDTVPPLLEPPLLEPPLLLPPLLLPPRLVLDWPVIVLEPPQPASSATQIKAIVENLTMSVILARPLWTGAF
jgi:hypothetical protein